MRLSTTSGCLRPPDDGVHTVRRRSLTRYVGTADEPTMEAVCRAVAYAIGC